MNGTSLFSKGGSAGLDTTGTKQVLNLSDALRKIKGISFVLLQLKDKGGKLVSHNTYWMSPGHHFTDLVNMPKADVNCKVIHAEKKNDYASWTIRFENNSSRLAFFLNPQVIKNGEEVLPSYWTDNYFSISAKQTLTVTVSCPLKEIGSSATALRMEGWNIETKNIELVH